jgi:hypothetical protein
MLSARIRKLWPPVEHKLQIISEAAIRLGSEAGEQFPGPDSRNIGGMGNWLRHQYERIELSVIFKSIKDDLPALKGCGASCGGSVGGKPERPVAGLIMSRTTRVSPGDKSDKCGMQDRAQAGDPAVRGVRRGLPG